MIWSLVLVALIANDPRPELVELQLEGRRELALQRVSDVLETRAEEVRPLGLDYLRGHLLERLGRGMEAHEAFAAAMASNPALNGYARYRLAVNQYRMGHPEVAAGLLATLLADRPPRELIPEASRLLAASIASGGDCRLLAGLDSWGIHRSPRRDLALAQGTCAVRSGRSDDARSLFLRLVEEEQSDEPARSAAQQVARLAGPQGITGGDSLILGLTFHQHRQFDSATVYLERGLEELSEGPSPSRADPEALYALARSYFWRGEYALAAVRFGRLAMEPLKPEDRARALYQRGRSLELHGDWSGASSSYRAVLEVDPLGRWTPAALLGALRIEWRGGMEEPALELFERLRSRRSWREMMYRAALFLASSDLVRGRSDRAEAWLRQAAGSRGSTDVEIAYWRGRLAELNEDPRTAVRRYLETLVEDADHPLAQAAGERLATSELAPVLRAESERLAASERDSDLFGAVLGFGADTAEGAAAREHLRRHLIRDPRARPFLEISQLAAAEWPLWKASLESPQEMLLAMGIVERDTRTVQKHFPVSEPSLALTGSRLLFQSRRHRESLYIAEILSRRIPVGVPQQMLPAVFQRLLYPLPYRPLIEREATRFEVDPFLLAAIIREESRFDPLAVSAASARGLTQFVLPTAERLGAKVGVAAIEAADLHRPEIAIALGAAYLAELAERFGGRDLVAVSAYNAGEDQARLWQSHCYSREAEEYFTKVGFTQTREYLRKVTSSRARYRAIYASTGSRPASLRPDDDRS